MADRSGTLYVDEPNTGSGVQSGGQPASEQRCPYLGLLEDPETCFGFPSEGNFCFGSRRIEPVPLITQEEVCLTGGYDACLVYQVRVDSPKEITRPLPDRLGGVRGRSRLALILAALLIVAAGLVLAGLKLGWFGPRALPASGLSAQPSSTVTLAQVNAATAQAPAATEAVALAAVASTPKASATRTATTTPTLTPTRSPTATFTPTPAAPTPGPALETPFGPNAAYLLHKVSPGESIPNLAGVYDTTIWVLYATNRFYKGQALWPGRVLVIMPGQKDTTGLPLFEIVQVEVDTQLGSLAEEFSSQVDLIRQYNDLGPADWVPSGRWLLIPVED